MEAKRTCLLIGAFLLFLSLLVACNSDVTDTQSQSEQNNNGQSENNVDTEDKEVKKQFSTEDTTIKVATPWGEEAFNGRIGDFASENLPHITIEHVDWDGTVENLEELYANDTIPDVFLAFTGQQPLEQLDSVYPLDDMIESYGVDLSHIQDVALDNVRSRDKERRLVGIPQETTVIGLYYNKEIFDLFGVGYPDPNESMTWDELMDLAPKLTGERSGTYYCGLEMVDLEYAPLSQLSVNKTDPETGEILLSSEPKFTQYIELMNRFYDLPGNDEESCGFEAKTTAMKIGWQGVLVYHDDDYWELDVAPIPVWKDLPGIGTEPSGHPWAINDFSENKDAALQFIIEGVSEEYQTILSKTGTPVPSSTGVPNQEYGADNPLMEGKNVAALFVNTPAPPPERKSPWDSFVEFDFEKLKESSDIQEFLRRTQEEWEIKIQEAKATQ